LAKAALRILEQASSNFYAESVPLVAYSRIDAVAGRIEVHATFSGKQDCTMQEENPASYAYCTNTPVPFENRQRAGERKFLGEAGICTQRQGFIEEGERLV
jgi:hypothetical protein